MNFKDFLILEAQKSETHLFPSDWLSGLNTDGETVTLYHYGEPGIDELDPSFWGKHSYTDSENWWGMPRVYFYTKKEDKERIVGGTLYQAKVPLKDLYPFNHDPLGIYEEVRKEQGYKPNIRVPVHLQVIYISTKLKEMGYKGMIYNWPSSPPIRIAAMWDKIPVTSDTVVKKPSEMPETDKVGWSIKNGMSTDPRLTSDEERIKRVAATMMGRNGGKGYDIDAYLQSMGSSLTINDIRASD